MKIEHYISQLLYRYQCVTVPGFGAFLTEIQSAQLKNENNGFYPPKKLVSFNAYLKNNDGLLANHIAQAEKITYETAVQSIQKEVSLWKNALQNYQPILIANVGIISVNAESNLVFEASNQINYYTAAFGLTSFIAPAIKRNEMVEAAVAPTETIVLVPEKRHYPYLKYAAVFAIGLGTIGFFGNNYYQNQIDAQTLIVQQSVQTAVQNKIQEATFFIKSPMPNVTLTVKGGKLPYHIVAGAFREESNAQRVFEKLSANGFKSRILPINKYGLFPVLYGSFGSYKEAQNAMRTIHKTQSPDAWLLIDEL